MDPTFLFSSFHLTLSHSTLALSTNNHTPMPYSTSLALVAGLSVFLSSAPFIAADPVDQCYNTGCGTALSILQPCGGGIANSSLLQTAVYTPTDSLAGCECNSYFYNLFSSCLSCITTLSQGQNNPEIQDQPKWTEECSSFGYNFTALPAITSSADYDASKGSGGLSKGAIVGIVIGALALLAVVGAFFFFRSRKSRHTKSDASEESGASTGATSGAVAIGSGSQYYNNTDDYYAHQQAGYEDPSGQQRYPSSEYQNGGYYVTEGKHDNMMMQNINNNNNGGYVPPPPHPASTTIQTTTNGTSIVSSPTAATYAAASRPSDTFPQSLRSRPIGWDNEKQEPGSSLLSSDHFHNDKAEFEDGEELEPPRSRSRFASGEDYQSRRSMTPPRATYRDEFRRPSLERGSDRGSVTGLRVDSDTEQQDSPESARRRARAAELFSAESRR
ncbi:hypothetical protein B0O80DRAFT_12358 [Mortierella sp. GBAus27b]|nr:hypothetical protein B0O80DRAFT_12358 [Mortierella sp. GBAus27b]